MKQGNIEQFQHLSKFNDIQDFNNNIEQWMIDIKKEFTKAERVALKRLVRFCAKVIGVCNAKIQTIVAATHEKEGFGISRSTFKRMILKAKGLGLLIVHEAERKNGSQSSNVYVFNRYGLPKVEKLNHHKTSNLSKTNNQNNNKRNSNVNDVQDVVQVVQELDASFTSGTVPVAFTSFVRCFYDDAKAIEEYWKIACISARKQKVYGDNQTVLEIALEAFRILVRKTKFSIVTNTYSFFYGICMRKFRAKYLCILFNAWWEGETV